MNILCKIPPHTSSIDEVQSPVRWVDTISGEHGGHVEAVAVIVDSLGNVGEVRAELLTVIDGRPNILPTAE